MDRKPLFVWALIGLLALTGCATTRIDLVQSNTVQVEKVDSDDAFVETVNVRQRDNEIEIEVILRPNESVRRFVAGQVQIDITAPDQAANPQTFKLTKPEKSQYGMDSKLQHVHFHTRFPYEAKPGTLIRVTHIHGVEAEETGHHNGTP